MPWTKNAPRFSRSRYGIFSVFTRGARKTGNTSAKKGRRVI